MDAHAIRLLDQATDADREWLLSVDFDTRAKLIHWVLSCGYASGTALAPEQSEFLQRAIQGSDDPKEKLHQIVAAAVSSLPYADKDALRRYLRRHDKTIYRDIGYWRWLSYDDLPCFSDRITQGWLREVYFDDIVIALKVEPQAFYDKIMRNLSRVAGEMMAADVAKAAAPTPEQVAVARQKILAGARKHLQETHAKTMEAEEEHDRLLLLAQAGDAGAQCDLACMYWYGASGWLNEDLETALHWFKQAAQQGSTDGLHGAGLVYRELGRHEEALKCFLESSERGNASASIKAANYYGDDEGSFHNAEKAAAYYLRAAEQGSTNVYARLGEIYASGEGVAQDYAAAREWFRKGAQAEDKVKQLHYGTCCFQYALFCEDGLGGEKDIAAAVTAYRNAAEDHSVEAAFNLGCLYFFGESLPHDLDEAEKWFLKAAEEGLPVAFYNLGCLNGEKDDLPQALMWFSLGKELGNEESAGEIEGLAATLSADDVRKGDAMAAEWKMQHGLLFSQATS